jgi:exopolyphosphatase/pppGpp-phosphohydrolase
MKKKVLLRGLNDNQRDELKSVLKVAKRCHYESGHTHRVTRLALTIFDDLGDLHKLGDQERFYLLCAALLHDVGVHTEGPHAHHKTALNIILNTPLLQFNQKDRLIIGSIARYHRRALPSKKHDHYRALDSETRNVVSILAGILRIADGMDYSHKRKIKDVQANFNKEKINFVCTVTQSPVKQEVQSTLKKCKLLEKVFDRKVSVKIREGEEFIGWS